MNTVAVDTNILVDAFHGDESFRPVLAAASRILVSPVVYAEFMAGFDDTRAGREAKDRFQSFLNISTAFMPTIGRETADIHALIQRQLRAAGTPIPQNDIWIAASALEHGAALCTRDTHFRSVANLLIVPDPAAHD